MRGKEIKMKNQRGNEHAPSPFVKKILNEKQRPGEAQPAGIPEGYIGESSPGSFKEQCAPDRQRYKDEVLHLYNNIPGAVFRCRFDRDFSVIDGNNGLYEFLGYTRNEFAAMGNKMSSVIHPEDFAVMTYRLTEQLRSGNTIKNENRLICKDGTVRWISIKAHLLVEEDGPYFYCVFVDITEEKQHQEQIKELYEKELAYFAELSSTEGNIQGCLNVTKGILENYVSTSDLIASYIGVSYDAVIEKMAQSAVIEEEGRKLRNILKREQVLEDFAAGKIDYGFDYFRRSDTGDILWENTKARACQNPSSGDVLLFFYTSDVTGQRLQERLLNKIAKLDYDIVTMIDLQKGSYQLAAYNSAWKQNVPLEGDFQTEFQNAAGRCMESEAKEEFLNKISFTYMKAELEKKDSYNFIIELNEGKGIKVKRYQIFYISKELERVCMTRADVTDVVLKEQRQKEELAAALVAANQANAAKSDFLSRMSHEIRTPMNAIIGMTAIAAHCIGDDEQVANCISKIGISSKFLLSLINDILDMSRIESGKMLLKNEKIPVEEFLRGINAICYDQAVSKSVEYECIIDPALDDYYIGDAMKLQQVLLNILSNAIKFTGEGGKVTFSAEQKRRTKNNTLLRFIINDTGIGMEEGFLPHIFEPFSQESTGSTSLYGGAGLGLAISKSIVDMMDGRITTHSIKGMGTEFIVDVKLGNTEGEKPSHNQKKQNYDFSGKRVLLVEDNLINTEVAVMLLQHRGFEVITAENGLRALELFSKSEKGYYNAILMDIRMPLMDGLAAASNIRQLSNADAKTVPIIAMTANAFDDDIEKSKSAGMNAHLAKPIEPERMYQTLYDFIFKKGD